MSWTSILSALSLATLTAYLVIIESWVLWKAFVLVAGGMLALVLTLIAIVLRNATEDERKEFWNGFLSVIRDSLRR